MRGQQQFEGMGDIPQVVPHPGDMGFEEWAQREDVGHHGSFLKDWDGASVTHFGTQASATDRLMSMHRDLKQQASNGPWIEYGPVKAYGRGELGNKLMTGRVMSRRMNMSPDVMLPMDQGISDPAANMVHRAYSLEQTGGEEYLSNDVLTSGTDFDEDAVFEGPDILDQELEHQARGAGEAMDSLRTGMTVPYRNYVEDSGSTSYLVPWARTNPNLTSYEQDVAASNRPQGVKDAVAEYTAKNGPVSIAVSDRDASTKWVEPALPLYEGISNGYKVGYQNTRAARRLTLPDVKEP